MDILALTELATPPETEVPELARDLGVTAYDARQKLAVGLPAVVLATTDRPRALALAAALRSRRHGVVACSSDDVVPSSAMTLVRRFRLDADALVLEQAAEARTGAAPELRIPFGDLLALIRATHRRSTETHEETKERKFRPMAAIASGGIILTKTVKRDVVRTNEEREPVLYLFRRGGGPCLLCESVAQYAGLGDAVHPTRVENFLATVRLLRERAAAAAYDERLMSVKKLPDPPNAPGAPRTFDPETGGVDLLAHVLAKWLTRGL